MIHEAGGLGEHIRDVVNRFANIGYVALGVDLYTREGGPPTPGDMEALFARLFSMPDERVLGDLDGAAEVLRAREDSTGKVGCIGFCMGGRYTLLFAAARERSSTPPSTAGAASSTKPRPRSARRREPRPRRSSSRRGSPARSTPRSAPRTRTPRPSSPSRCERAAAESGHEVEVEVYEGAGHAFFADYRPSLPPGAGREAVGSRWCRSWTATCARPRRRTPPTSRAPPAGAFI